MAMDYKNVSGKWRFLIGRQDQKGRAFPANPELDNSRDLDSGLCVCVCVCACVYVSVCVSLICLVQVWEGRILEWSKSTG